MNKEAKISTDVTDIELGSPLARIRARGKFVDKDALDFVPTPESLHLYIDTPNYDGPLDLLLHLIRKHSMDIFDIPIVNITQKYLAALDEMESLNLDIAGEFLVMAATLAEIKSKMLLPKEERKQEEDEEEGEDPREGLMRRLLLYQSFKEASLELNQMSHLGRDIFLRPIAEAKDDEQTPIDLGSALLAPIEIFTLAENFTRILKQTDALSIHTITRDRISVSSRLSELIDFCQIRSKFSFYDALRFFAIYEKIDVIVTFLALLEMSRLRLILINNSDYEDLSLKIDKANFFSKHQEVLSNLEGQNQVNYD